ncbi:hypothetical protein NFI96_033347, partial [Prochilodus magdalenae]
QAEANVVWSATAMLALNTYFWIHKSPFPRHVSGIVAMTCKVKPVSPHRDENPGRCTERPVERLAVANFHTSALQSRNLLMKMLSKKKKKRWYEAPPQPSPVGQSGFLTPAKKKTQEDSQRVRTLNIIIYKAVSDLLASHEVNAEIPSYSVEITKVSFPVDFSSCRIYWKTSCSADRDSKVQQVLDRSAPRIRYLLMSLQILSNVPPVVFVRDKKYAALQEVERLLEVADYGPREDSENLSIGGQDAEARLRPVEPVDKKRPLWFDIDHEALHKQIEDYKQRSGDTFSESTSSGGLTQEQLDTLAEIRKQKLIEKKKRKSKKMKDDDITPKAFLLTRQLQEEEQEEEECSGEHGSEDRQVSELMVDYSRKS